MAAIRAVESFLGVSVLLLQTLIGLYCPEQEQIVLVPP